MVSNHWSDGLFERQKAGKARCKRSQNKKILKCERNELLWFDRKKYLPFQWDQWYCKLFFVTITLFKSPVKKWPWLCQDLLDNYLSKVGAFAALQQWVSFRAEGDERSQCRGTYILVWQLVAESVLWESWSVPLKCHLVEICYTKSNS